MTSRCSSYSILGQGGRGEAVGCPVQGPALHAAGRGDPGAGLNIVATVSTCLMKSKMDQVFRQQYSNRLKYAASCMKSVSFFERKNGSRSFMVFSTSRKSAFVRAINTGIFQCRLNDFSGVVYLQLICWQICDSPYFVANMQETWNANQPTSYLFRWHQFASEEDSVQATQQLPLLRLLHAPMAGRPTQTLVQASNASNMEMTHLQPPMQK